MKLPPPYSHAGLAMVMIPLYAGPILAGWGSAPLSVVVVFAAIFTLYLTATRRIDVTRLSGVAHLGLLALVQIAICIALFWLGRVAASLTSALPISLWISIGLTLGAAALGMRRYRHQSEMDQLLDQALTSINHFTSFDMPIDADTDSLVSKGAGFRARLWDAPITEANAENILDAFETENPASVLQWMLADFREGSDTYDLAVLHFLARDDVWPAQSHDSFVAITIEGGLSSPHVAVRTKAAQIAAMLMDRNAPHDALPDAAWFDDAHPLHADVVPTADRIHRYIGLGRLRG
ncbi:hypothetical protein G5B38_14365 [Pseudohalocynthiibacter aestuariivivens]|nr:hypothetical protein [Pseudohalocynthiibacter aestuariivivens]QIE46611.1 hypothetical protein G5B38_14365 [Pseudohalocynthiibacter aestuariivivens]